MTVSHLLQVVDVFQVATALPDSTISHRVFGDSKKIAALRNGADIVTGRYAAAIGWFSANWPEDATWPDDVTRPELAVQP